MPIKLVEDADFPLKIGETATKIWIHLKSGDKKLVVEKKCAIQLAS